MVYKYDFSVFGDTLYPEKIINRIKGNFFVESCFSSTDNKFHNSSDKYGYGGVSFWHPLQFSTEDEIVRYEDAFVKFIEVNYALFIKNGADEFQIFIEIYYDGGQCNFEVFNKKLLKRLAKFNVSIPISVYALKKRELKKWEKEIKQKWMKY